MAAKDSQPKKVRCVNRPSAGVAVADKPSSSTVKVKLGSVTVEVRRPTRAEVKRNVIIGQTALSRVLPRLMRPGVRLGHPASVPLYRADPENSELLIRVLRGKTSRGRFVGGKFNVVKVSQAARKAIQKAA